MAWFRLQSTTKVLGVFYGQSINYLCYFEGRIARQGDSNKLAIIKMYVNEDVDNLVTQEH